MKSELIKFMRERVFDMTDKIPDAGEQSAFLAGGLAAVTQSGPPKPPPASGGDLDDKVREAAIALRVALDDALATGVKAPALADDVQDALGSSWVFGAQS